MRPNFLNSSQGSRGRNVPAFSLCSRNATPVFKKKNLPMKIGWVISDIKKGTEVGANNVVMKKQQPRAQTPKRNRVSLTGAKKDK